MLKNLKFYLCSGLLIFSGVLLAMESDIKGENLSEHSDVTTFFSLSDDKRQVFMFNTQWVGSVPLTSLGLGDVVIKRVNSVDGRSMLLQLSDGTETVWKVGKTSDLKLKKIENSSFRNPDISKSDKKYIFTRSADKKEIIIYRIDHTKGLLNDLDLDLVYCQLLVLTEKIIALSTSNGEVILVDTQNERVKSYTPFKGKAFLMSNFTKNSIFLQRIAEKSDIFAYLFDWKLVKVSAFID